MRMLHLLPKITEPFEVNKVDGANLVNRVDDLDSDCRLDREHRLDRLTYPTASTEKCQEKIFHSTR